MCAYMYIVHVYETHHRYSIFPTQMFPRPTSCRPCMADHGPSILNVARVLFKLTVISEWEALVPN